MKKQLFTFILITSFIFGSAQGVQEKNSTDSFPASFIGGQQSWLRFIITSLKMPEFFRKEVDNVKITCIVDFTVDSAGKVVNAKIVKSGCCGADEEALRIINASDGLWNPANIKGKYVSYHITQPITFSMQQSEESQPLSLEELKQKYETWKKKKTKS